MRSRLSLDYKLYLKLLVSACLLRQIPEWVTLYTHQLLLCFFLLLGILSISGEGRLQSHLTSSWERHYLSGMSPTVTTVRHSLGFPLYNFFVVQVVILFVFSILFVFTCLHGKDVRVSSAIETLLCTLELTGPSKPSRYDRLLNSMMTWCGAWIEHLQ